MIDFVDGICYNTVIIQMEVSIMSKKSREGGSRISLNQVSFWLLVVAAVLYLVGIILSALKLQSITSYLLAVASALMVCVVAILAWRYVAHKPAVWKVLYFIVLLVVLAGLVIPSVILSI